MRTLRNLERSSKGGLSGYEARTFKGSGVGAGVGVDGGVDGDVVAGADVVAGGGAGKSRGMTTEVQRKKIAMQRTMARRLRLSKSYFLS
jgi:hypothetical protein